MTNNDKIPAYFKLDKLMTDITECITGLSGEFSCINVPIDDGCTVFHRFCAKLEHFLSLGFKEKSNLFGKKRGYWDYMLKSLVSNRGGVHEGLKFVKSNQELKTSLGRGRAFLRFCLVHQCLADTLQQCYSGHPDLIAEWYADWAPVRDSPSLSLLITSLYDLNNVQFDLSSPSCHDLDVSWPVFNRKEFGSPFSWKAISRSGSISSLTSSVSAVDNLNSARPMGAMGSVQEGSEGSGGGVVEDGAIREEGAHLGLAGQSQRSTQREKSEEKDVWWMTEQEIPEADSSRNMEAEAHSWVEESERRMVEAEEQLRGAKEEVERREGEWRRKEEAWEGRESEWREREGRWRRREEEWERREREWREERERRDGEHTRMTEVLHSRAEEQRIEVDVLRAKILELEVVRAMAEGTSVGVQATDDKEREEAEVMKKKKVEEMEERLVSVCQENEELKKELEQMKVACKEAELRCTTSELMTSQLETQKSDLVDCSIQQTISRTSDSDLRREYESQIQNVRELRGMYEERMKTTEEQNRKLREVVQEKNRRLELSQKRCSELRAHAEELETLLGEQEGVARGLQARLSTSLEEGRGLATQLAMVNRLFARLGDTAELDFERLRLLQNSSENGDGEENGGVRDGAGENGKEESADLREIAVSLPKVWRLLVELLGEEQKEEGGEEEANRAETEVDGCFDSVPTPYGPRLVISVSRTFIRLKDLILEKKSLQNELGRIRDLNGRLESKLKQQERRLATVKVELKRTWSLVAKMRAQHRQLHTSEQVLRYELQQKRKLLGELKQELEYCREKWDLARLKNSQSEKEWQILREEFRARKSVDGNTGRDSTEVNSPESGFSDGRGEDEEEDLDGDIEGDMMAVMDKGDSPECALDPGGEIDKVVIDPATLLAFPCGEETFPTVSEDPPSPSSEHQLSDCLEPANEKDANGTEIVHSQETPTLNGNDEVDRGASLVPHAAASNSATTTSQLEVRTTASRAGVSTEQSMEERLHARAERLRRLEEQCSQLFKKVTRTTTRSAELSSRLEELHEQYGEQQQTMNGEGRQAESPPLQADTETGETLSNITSSMVVRSASVPQQPLIPAPPPPPLPNLLPVMRLPCILDQPASPPLMSSSDALTVSGESLAGSSAVTFSNNLARSLETEEHRSDQISFPPQSHASDCHVSESNVVLESKELVKNVSENVLENNGEQCSSGILESSGDGSVPQVSAPSCEVTETVCLCVTSSETPSVGSAEFFPPMSSEEPMDRTGEETDQIPVVDSASNVSAQAGDSGMFGGIIEEEEEEEGLSTGEEDEDINLDALEVSIGGEDSLEGDDDATTEEREETDDEEAYIARMSSTIYGLHHGPLFDEGGATTSPSEDDEGEGEAMAEDGDDGDDDDDDDDDEMDEDGLSGNAITSGSIGVASLLLQQLPKRMDILRRERHSLEQRLEEGEAALGRAQAGTAAAERRARMLERGLAQAQERLQVLELEAAVERNKRLLEIKSSLDAAAMGDGHAVQSVPEGLQQGVVQSRSSALQEEVDNLQQQTLAQIADLKAAAVVSQEQKEQLNTLSEEIERQERTVSLLESELASLRSERKEQAKALEDASEQLKNALVLLSNREEESRAMQRQLDKLREELNHSTEENVGLTSKLAVAEAEVSQLSAEVEQLRDDSVRLQEVVIKLTGEKEDLFRANHRLEEMRRLVLEDPKWVSDREIEACTACGVTFSLMVRRHHCRSCGKIFCGACSSHWLALSSGPGSQASSLVVGMVESLIGSGKRSRACAECFAAYASESAEAESRISKASRSQESRICDSKPGSSKTNDGGGSSNCEGSNDPGLPTGDGVVEDDSRDDDDDEDIEDFSMISEEEVYLSQCTPYVPNPRTLQYWKSCEIQSGVTSTVSDLLGECVAEGGVPGRGKTEEVWVRAGAIYSVPLLIEDKHVDILWEFSTNPNSIAFSVLYKSSMDVPMSSALIVVPTTRVNSHLMPARGRLRPKRAGVYILMFDNSFSRFTGKTISYTLRAEMLIKGASGRDSVTSSSRSSVEPFPDLPIHEEAEVEGEGQTEADDTRDNSDDIVRPHAVADEG